MNQVFLAYEAHEENDGPDTHERRHESQTNRGQEKQRGGYGIEGGHYQMKFFNHNCLQK